MTMTSALGTDDKETSKEVEELVLPGLHSKFNKSGLEFLKSSFLRHVHEILEQGIPDGERQVGDALRFSWSDLKCPKLEEKDPVLEIAAGEGMKGSIEIDAFSIDGNWGYAYKKGLFRWTDSGTFHLAFTKLRVNITMSITIEGPDKQLKLFIRPGNADVEAQDVEIKMKSLGVMTQGIINVALPHIRHMWRKPAELSKKIEETANQNLKEIVRLLPVSYPLKREILGHSFHVGNMFQSQFDIAEEYCYWELSSVIIPTAVFAEFLEREEARERERETNKPGKPRLPNRRNRGGATEASAKSVSEELHPFSPANFLFPQPEVPKMTRHPAARGTEDHISYCLSEFTLNTWASSLYDLKLCEASLTDWEKVPGYLQRYIATFCRKEPDTVQIKGKLTARPEVTIEPDGAELRLEGWIVVAAERESMYDIFEPRADSFGDDDEEEYASRWKMFHKTRHELRLRITPRVDKDFVAKFSFEKIDCKSTFESTVSKTSGLKIGSKSGKDSARKTMLDIVENMIIVELLPRLYEVGEVGIPLTINEGCLFETRSIDFVPHAFIVSGLMRLKDFGKKLSGDSNDNRRSTTTTQETTTAASASGWGFL